MFEHIRIWDIIVYIFPLFIFNVVCVKECFKYVLFKTTKVFVHFLIFDIRLFSLC